MGPRHETRTGHRRKAQLTDNGLHVFLRTEYACLSAESWARAQCEGKGLVIFAQVVVHFADDQCGQVARVRGQVVRLVECLAEDHCQQRRETRNRGCSQNAELLCDFMPELGHEWVQSLERVLPKRRVRF